MANTDHLRGGASCSGCEQHDNHPKHHVYRGGRLARNTDGTFVIDPATGQPVLEAVIESQHLDCCNCGLCATKLEYAGDRRGLELAEFLTNPPVELQRALADEHGVEIPGSN